MFTKDSPKKKSGLDGPYWSFFLYFLACFGNFHAFLGLTEFLGASFNELEVGLGVGSLFLTVAMSLSGVVVKSDYFSFLFGATMADILIFCFFFFLVFTMSHRI